MKKVAVVVLDATGSMTGQEERVVSSMNEYVRTLPKKCHLTVFLFDSKRWDTFYEGQAKDWRKMRTADYQPGAMTPLYDSIAKGIKHAKGLSANETNKVLVMIDTDGFENASQEHTQTSVKALFDQCKADGWEFIFMASGIDEVAAQKVAATGDAMGMTVNSAAYAARAANYATASTLTDSYFDDDKKKTAKTK